MKIIVSDFINGEGAQYSVTAESETERVLLYSCVDPEVGYFKETNLRNIFHLVLPVSNGG